MKKLGQALMCIAITLSFYGMLFYGLLHATTLN